MEDGFVDKFYFEKYSDNDLGEKYEDAPANSADPASELPQIFVHGAIVLYLKGFRPTLRELRELAAQVCLYICQDYYKPQSQSDTGSSLRITRLIGEAARVKDIFLDVHNSMHRLDASIAELRHKAFEDSFQAPNREVNTFPTQSLQSLYLHMALDKAAPDAPFKELKILEDVRTKLNLRFFKRVRSVRVVVDDMWFGKQLFPDMLFAYADQDQGEWITGSTSPKYLDHWPEMHEFLANVKRYQIGPTFSNTYLRMQNELCLMERRFVAEIEASADF